VLIIPWHVPAGRASIGGAPAPLQPERVAALLPTKVGPGGLPMTGKALDVLAPLDEAMEKIMLRHGIPGASVAITKNGKLVFARGYGWSHFERKELASPISLFGLASVSKCFTALAVLKLVEEGKLKLDQKAFDFFKGLKPPPRMVVDPRLGQITIRQLLNHTGGWDRDKSGDPINWSYQVSQRLGVPMPIGDEHLIRFMLGVPLDFAPGTRAVYSNFGFILLGQIVARVSGQPYEEYVRIKVLKPMGIQAARMHDREGTYFKGEARRYNPGFLQAMPPYNLPWTDASGGWTASAVDLARMMTALDGSRTGKPFLPDELMNEMMAPPPPPVKSRPDGSHFGLGWDTVKKLPKGNGYQKGGAWPGVRSAVKHRVDGVDTVIVSNALAQLDQLDFQMANDAIREVHEVMNDIKEWPKVDLFEEYR
jgi:N-acyl-D-amino-acid deacylase